MSVAVLQLLQLKSGGMIGQKLAIYLYIYKYIYKYRSISGYGNSLKRTATTATLQQNAVSEKKFHGNEKFLAKHS